MSKSFKKKQLEAHNCTHQFTLKKFEKSERYYVFYCIRCDQPAVSKEITWGEEYEHGVTAIRPNMRAKAEVPEIINKSIIEMAEMRGYFEWRANHAVNWNRFTFNENVTNSQIKSAINSYRNMGLRIR